MSKLFIIPTPIGNLEDITLRALTVLKEVDLILAEDTRVSGKLLKRFEVTTSMKSYHAFNEHGALQKYLDQLITGKKLALISDAGTPGISDPGYLLIHACIENQIEVECLPGPTAFVPALLQSGFPTDRFVFEGFLPHKKGRQKRIENLQDETRTIVFYESPYRLKKLLSQLGEILGGNREVAVCKELTKLYETCWRGTVSQLTDTMDDKAIKGEFVVVVKGKEK